jgi:hypothetical protein
MDQIDVRRLAGFSAVVDGSHPSSDKPGKEKTQAGEDVENIGSADDHNASRFQHAGDLPNQLGLMFDMLDDLGEVDSIKAGTAERERIVEVNPTHPEDVVS